MVNILSSESQHVPPILSSRRGHLTVVLSVLTFFVLNFQLLTREPYIRNDEYFDQGQHQQQTNVYPYQVYEVCIVRLSQLNSRATNLKRTWYLEDVQSLQRPSQNASVDRMRYFVFSDVKTDAPGWIVMNTPVKSYHQARFLVVFAPHKHPLLRECQRVILVGNEVVLLGTEVENLIALMKSTLMKYDIAHGTSTGRKERTIRKGSLMSPLWKGIIAIDLRSSLWQILRDWVISHVQSKEDLESLDMLLHIALVQQSVSVFEFSASSFMTESIHVTRYPTDEFVIPQPPFEVCFVTSLYSREKEAMDQLDSVLERARRNPLFRYCIFANIPTIQFPGWTTVVHHLRRYNRFITQSRWGKFRGWEHPVVQQCKVVFYHDAILVPSQTDVEFLKIAKEVRTHPTGVAQYTHPKGNGISKEFSRILKCKKDIEVNVNKTRMWLMLQPDFDDNCTFYENSALAYSPFSQIWQKVRDFFWRYYSSEDASWRDQPLWAFTMNHFGVKPLILERSDHFFEIKGANMGFDKHQYTDLNVMESSQNEYGNLGDEWMNASSIAALTSW